MKVIKTGLLLFFIICTSSFVSAQIKFEAKLSKKTLGVNERLRVDFEMNRDGDNFNPPDFEGFRVVGGPNQAISSLWDNGVKTFSKTYTYFLAPIARGKFTIKQATIQVDGETYKTLPVNVEVTAAVDKPKDGNNAEFIASKNIHLVAEVSNKSPFLNEAITVVYKLYVSQEVSVTRSWREIDIPKYSDFWSQNIENKQFKVYEGKYKGQDYRYVILRRTVLYPQKTGPLLIESLVLDVPVDVNTNKRDIFGRRLKTTVNKTVSAGNITINVKELPTEGKPENFSGAVGDFTFVTTTSKFELDANESLELKLKVSGTGNLKLFDLPSINLPASLEVYEPVRENNVRTNSSGMKGNISEKYTIVPQFKGNYPIRPIAFTFFDIASKKYKTIYSKELLISVLNGPVSTTSSEENTTSSTNKSVVFSKDQFKFIKLKPNLQLMTKAPFFKSSLFWWLFGSPFVLIPLFIIIGKKRKSRMQDLDGNRRRKANRLAKKYLSEAKKNRANQNQFYESLERALHNYLKAKLHIETFDMAKETIQSTLLDRGAENQVVSNFISLLTNCEFARYASSSSNSIQQDYDRAVEEITNLDKQI